MDFEAFSPASWTDCTRKSGFWRLIGNESNRSYLRELPIFRIGPKLPSTFDSLLEDIDRAERELARRNRSRPS
jgi:hypothetical protein